MTKRGIMHFSGSTSIFRISRPGVVVDSAAIEDLLLHENMLFQQPYFSTFVECPFAGDTSSNTRDATVRVNGPNVGVPPQPYLYMVDSNDAIQFPHQQSSGTNSDTGGNTTEAWTVRAWVVSNTAVDVRFHKLSQVRRSPNGAYLILARSANA